MVSASSNNACSSSTSLGRAVGVALTLAWLMAPAVAAAATVPLALKVVHAHNKDKVVDAKLAGLVKDLSALKFTGYVLKDEATFNLELGAAGRMQLPSGAWMTVVPREIASDGKLRLELEVKALKFKTVVAIAKGATLAVGGPPYDEGALILAVSRPAEP